MAADKENTGVPGKGSNKNDSGKEQVKKRQPRKNKNKNKGVPKPPQKPAKTEPLQCIWGSKDKKAAEMLVMNLLDTKCPQKLARPMPVKSNAQLNAGEWRLTSAANYVGVVMRPDPFNFLEITTEIADGAQFSTVPEQNEDIQLLCSNTHEGINGTVPHAIAYQLPIYLTDNTYLRGQRVESGLGGGVVPISFDSTKNAQPYLVGFSGLAIPTATQFVFNVINNGSVAINARAQIAIVDTANPAFYAGDLGSITAIGANAAGVCAVTTSAVRDSTEANKLLVMIVQISCQSGSGFVRYRDLAFTLPDVNVSSAPYVIAFTSSTQVLTIGEACFGFDTKEQRDLDALYSQAELWAPVCCNATFNVSQELKDAGGRFQTSYLPSFVYKNLKVDLDKQWTQIANYKRSYPVAETEFRLGGQGSWIGARIADYEFRSPASRTGVRLFEAESMPSLHFIANKVSAAAEASYYFNFAAAFEVQTVNPTINCTLGPCSLELMPYFLALATASDKLVGENPSHIDRLKRIVKAVVSDPRFINAGKFLLKSGLTGLMTLM